jgi:hypothetical protein
MTAIPLSAPQRLRPTRQAGPRRTVAGQASRRPPSGCAVNGRIAQRGVGREDVHLRLTRRGRLLITSLLFLSGLAVTLFTGGVSLAGTESQPVPVRYVTVVPGDTLWSIAGEAAPGADRRDTVHRIVELNALPGPELFVGQRVAVPARG